MFNALKQMFSGDVFVLEDPRVWHVRFYLYWMALGGKNGKGYRENWCHYWRVVIFHAPRRWLFEESVLWRTQKRFVLVGLYGIACFWGWFASTQKESVARGLGVFLMTLVGATLLLVVWVGVVLFLRQTGRWAGSFAKRRSWELGVWGDRAGVTVIGLTLFGLLGWLGFGLYYLATRWPFQAGLVAGTIVVVGIGGIGVKQWKMRRRRFASPKANHRGHANRVGIVSANVGGTLKFVAQFVGARKRRVCPYVEFNFDLQAVLAERKRRHSRAS